MKVLRMLNNVVSSWSRKRRNVSSSFTEKMEELVSE